MIYRSIACVLTVLALAACSTNSHSIRTEFNPQEAQYIFTVGRAAITGQAFIRTPDGRTHPARRSVVTLVPATRYAQERIKAIYGGREGASKPVKFPNADPRYRFFTKKTTADSAGRFAFLDISDGEYFITTTVTYRGKARALVKRVKLTNSAKIKVVLSEGVS